MYVSAYVARTSSSNASRSPSRAAVTSSATSCGIEAFDLLGAACRYAAGKPGYRVSLCTVWVRSQRQYFFISMRSRSFTLFLVVM